MRELAYLESLGAVDWESAAGWTSVINQAAQGLTSGTASTSSIGSAVVKQSLAEAGRWAADQPMVRVNRARGAALIDYGYEWIETLDRWRPYIFTGSTVAAGLSAFALWKRKRIPEAWVVYLPLLGISGGLAWLLRPAALRPPPAPLPVSLQNSSQAAPVASQRSISGLGASPAPQEAPKATGTLQQILGWLDRRAAKLAVKEPGWEPQAYARLARDLGWSTMPSYVTGFLNRNAL
jgi:hypothetical protein